MAMIDDDDDDDDDDGDGLLCCDSVDSGCSPERQRRSQSSVVPDQREDSI